MVILHYLLSDGDEMFGNRLPDDVDTFRLVGNGLLFDTEQHAREHFSKECAGSLISAVIVPCSELITAGDRPNSKPGPEPQHETETPAVPEPAETEYEDPEEMPF